MSLTANIFLAVSCLMAGQWEPTCLQPSAPTAPTVVAAQSRPVRASEALDVMISAQAAVAWDRSSGAILYEKNAADRRPIASLAKLLSTLVVRHTVATEAVVEIPAAVRATQRLGAHIRLVPGEHARVDDLLAASLIASANDAMVTLATSVAGSEEKFTLLANKEGRRLGLQDTHLANSTGLPGGENYSTAHDVRRLLSLATADPVLGQHLNDKQGILTSVEGTRRQYESTNDLLSTYLPIIAAKTGYTIEAGENVALFTRLADGHEVGIVILGSTQRFQDAKILAEWIQRHYTWPAQP